MLEYTEKTLFFYFLLLFNFKILKKTKPSSYILCMNVLVSTAKGFLSSEIPLKLIIFTVSLVTIHSSKIVKGLKEVGKIAGAYE